MAGAGTRTPIVRLKTWYIIRAFLDALKHTRCDKSQYKLILPQHVFFLSFSWFFFVFLCFFTGAGRFGGVAEWKRRWTSGEVKVEVVMGDRQSRPEFRVASPQATVKSGAQLWLLCGRLRVWRSCRVSEKVVAPCIEAKSNRVRCRLRRCPCCKNDTRGRCGCRTVSGWV